MLGVGPPTRKPSRDEAEKPFWISFSDMMTALMVLFLVVMTVALLAVTHTISESERLKAARDTEIKVLMAKMMEASKIYPGIRITGSTIDFGEQARFDTDSDRLTPAQARQLRAFIPHILKIARDPLGKKWIKRVVVEGYADQRGTYIHNLDLSIKRSENVLFALLADPEPGETTLTPQDRLLVQQLFLVGGASFNSLKKSLEESRRIELKMEFLEMGETTHKKPSIELAQGHSFPYSQP